MRKPIDTPIATVSELDEEMLDHTVSDEALEAAADTDVTVNNITNSFIVWSDPCCH